ncbi:SixA phosphatase family protein [Methylophaga sp.]|uniref:SixA phosphatase family protein n=1 Tax=Methylophaga sp. TaxID=2024840 RepID=UPI003F69BA5B
MAIATKQIMLMRHAKAEPGSHGNDFSRRLTEAGQQHSINLGKLLYDLKLLPQSVYSSSATRALETASLVCEQLFIDSSQITIRDELYLANVYTLLSLLQQLDNRLSRVMLVGHNPALEELVDTLSHLNSGSNESSDNHMSPATLIMLEFQGDWFNLGSDSCNIIRRIDRKNV